MNTPRSVRTIQMYGHRSTGFWVVIHCPNGPVPPPTLFYGPYRLEAIGTPAEVLSEINRWLGTRGVYKPLRAIGRVIDKSPRQVGRYLSGEVAPEPGPGWEGLVQIRCALEWEQRWAIWKRLARSPRTYPLLASAVSRG